MGHLGVGINNAISTAASFVKTAVQKTVQIFTNIIKTPTTPPENQNKFPASVGEAALQLIGNSQSANQQSQTSNPISTPPPTSAPTQPSASIPSQPPQQQTPQQQANSVLCNGQYWANKCSASQTFYCSPARGGECQAINKPNINTSELEQQIHALINNERQKQGLTALSYDGRLADIARGHSQNMATRNYAAHVSPDGCDPACRYKQNNYQFSMLAENISGRTTYKTRYADGVVDVYNTQAELALWIVQGWMASSGHRANILTPALKNEGIGVVIKDDGGVLTTEDFAVPSGPQQTTPEQPPTPTSTTQQTQPSAPAVQPAPQPQFTPSVGTPRLSKTSNLLTTNGMMTYFSGSGFTPGGGITVTIVRQDGTRYTPYRYTANSNGDWDTSYSSGNYTTYWTDDETGKRSDTVTETYTPPASAVPSIPPEPQPAPQCPQTTVVDGQTVPVMFCEIDKYSAFYGTPLITIYSTNGGTQTIHAAQYDATYKSNQWFLTADAAAQARVQSTPTASSTPSAQPTTQPYSDAEALKRLSQFSIDQLQTIYRRITGAGFGYAGSANANNVSLLSSAILNASADTLYGADIPEIGLHYTGKWPNLTATLDAR